MIGMRALVDIWDTIGTMRAGQFFYVIDDDYANMLVSQKRAERASSASVPMVPVDTALPTAVSLLAEPKYEALQWPEMTLVILASGPSMNESQVEQVKEWRSASDLRRVAAINTTFRLAPWADLLYACDDRWWKIYHEEVNEKFSSLERWTQDIATLSWTSDVKRIESCRGDGLSKTLGVIHQGMNSGYQMIGLAVQAGVKKIILLGFDMKTVDKKTHWHGDHPNPINAANPYRRWIDNFDQLSSDLKGAGIEVVNATPDSALKCFPAMPLMDALA